MINTLVCNSLWIFFCINWIKINLPSWSACSWIQRKRYYLAIGFQLFKFVSQIEFFSCFSSRFSANKISVLIFFAGALSELLDGFIHLKLPDSKLDWRYLKYLGDNWLTMDKQHFIQQKKSTLKTFKSKFHSLFFKSLSNIIFQTECMKKLVKNLSWIELSSVYQWYQK